MMITIPRINVKNSSSLDSSKHESRLCTSASSFQKPELSKDCDCGDARRIEIEPQRRLGQHQKIKTSDSSNPIKKSCLKSTNNINSSTTDSSRVKSVNFEKTARVRRVRPRNHFSQKELENMWYTEEDYISIKRGAMETVKKMLKAEKVGGFIDDENYSARGLECRMKKNAVERKEFKAFARELVLREQDDQNNKGIFCSSRLRKVYLKASSISSTKAQISGRRDAEVVDDTCS
eukprot:CAMPEP_0116129142 /NCGR_PEP_ID=MMETSP0329-20121206/7771_1 /TAXON_ID=697910 /ORGANISM="Pseudo-nitzschia arenysensis, Strain B593" /LENGTH=233 /DNA_ID=CAMNT_0003623399 /DNA_START=15 /DNA_END=713 /DNA_ORIENTATION=+